jgi:hypothetical protein
VVRDDDVVISPTNIDFVAQFASDESNFGWAYYDDAPVSASHTYRLQLLKTVGSGNAGLHVHVQLLATLLKK